MMFSCKTVPQSFEFLGGVFATQTQEGQICYVEGRAGCRNVSVAAHGAGQGANTHVEGWKARGLGLSLS